MANIITNAKGGLISASSNNTTGQNGSVDVISVASVNESVASLSDIRNYLQPINSKILLESNICPYDHIIEMIRGLDLQDDGIKMNHKIKSIETDFRNIVRDENMLCASMEYINDKALEDDETAIKFALLFASRSFDVLAMKETKVRTTMLTLLQKNFLNAETYRVHDRERLYNSITILGEYYHRVRLADNSPINILGESLLNLLIEEIKEEKNVNDVKLARLILSQITLNGNLMRTLHKKEISQLLYHIRKNLIEQPNLKPTIKAIMLMTLDLFYSNFESLGSQLEEMYSKYIIMQNDDEDNNNQNQQQSSEVNHHHHQQQQQNQCNNSVQEQNYTSPSTQFEHQNHSYDEENGDSGNLNGDNENDPDSCKKWSEQVREGSLEEKNGVKCELNINDSDGLNQDSLNKSYTDDYKQQQSCNSHYNIDSDRESRHKANSSSSPRLLKQNVNEECDEPKPLPRSRNPKFNRNNQQKENRSCNAQRRSSTRFDRSRPNIYSDDGSINDNLEYVPGTQAPNIRTANSNWCRRDEDRQNTCSGGGSINDRLKYAQRKIEHPGTQATNTGTTNSNWSHKDGDRQNIRSNGSSINDRLKYAQGKIERPGTQITNTFITKFNWNRQSQ